MIFIEMPAFTKHSPLSDEELRAVQTAIVEDPAAGDLIPGGHGLRKLRTALPGRGKRGGARVIYYWWPTRNRCYLVFAYAKNVRGDLTPAQVRMLAAVMKEELNDE